MRAQKKKKMVKIAFGSIGDSLSVGSLKAYLAEFIATLLFVFAGVGSAIAFSKSHFPNVIHVIYLCISIKCYFHDLNV